MKASASAAGSRARFPIFLVVRTDWWEGEDGSDCAENIDSMVVSAFTTLLRAQEAALIEFDDFAEQFDEMAQIGDLSPCWTGSVAERYKQMVEEMETFRESWFYGSIFRVEKATLPASARAQALKAPFPVPFPIFLVTRNIRDDDTVLHEDNTSFVYNTFIKARTAAVNSYSEYLQSNPHEAERIQWNSNLSTAQKYDRMIEMQEAVKEREYEFGTSFRVHESVLYPRGTYPVHQDKVTEEEPEENGYSHGTYPRYQDSSDGEIDDSELQSEEDSEESPPKKRFSWNW